MPDFLKACDTHVPDLLRGKQTPIGYIPEFTPLPSGVALMRDLDVAWAGDEKSAAVYFPMNPIKDKVSVVGLVSEIFWNTQSTGSIIISCQMSPANVSRLRAGRVDLARFGFYIADFDFITKRYFGCFYPNSPGIMDVRIGDLEVAHESSNETRFASYAVQFEAQPIGARKNLSIGVADGKTVVKAWAG